MPPRRPTRRSCRGRSSARNVVIESTGRFTKAFGEFATGIGNTDAGFVMGTGKLWLKVPPTMRFVFHGKLPPYLMAKDLILAVIGDIGCDGATYRAMEFDGDGVYALNIEERMTLCNMVIEAGGKNGVIAPDQVTLDYVNDAATNRARSRTPVAEDRRRREVRLREGLRRDQAGAGHRQAAQPGQPGVRLRVTKERRGEGLGTFNGFKEVPKKQYAHRLDTCARER